MGSPRSGARLGLSQLFALFVVLLLAAALGSFAYMTQRIQREILQARLERAASYAHLFEEQVTQTFNVVQLVLETVRDQTPDQPPDQPQLLLLFQNGLNNAPFLRSLSLADGEGRILASSDARNEGGRLHLERQIPREGADGVMRFEPTRPGRDFHEQAGAPQVSFLPVARRLDLAGHTYYLVASVNPDFFLNHFENVLPPGLGSVDVLLSDGSLLFSTQSDLAPGQVHPQDLGLSSFAETGFGVMEGRRHDGLPALSAYRSSRLFPLLLSAHLDRQLALRDWQREVRDLAWFMALGVLLILIPSTLLFLREQRNRQLRAEATAALASSEERYRLTFAAVRDGLWDWDLEQDSIRCDAHWYEMLGYPADAFPVTRESWLALLHPQDRDRVRDEVSRQMEQGDAFCVAFRMLKADGDWLWIEGRGQTVAREAGRPTRAMGTHTDISARVAAEEAVAAASRHRAALLAHIAAGVFVASTDRIIREVSARGAEMFGYRPEELVGQSFRCLHLDMEHFTRLQPLYAILARDGQVQEDYPLRTKDGRVRWISLYGTWLQEEGREVIWTMLDITFKHQMQEALQTSRKRLEVLISQFPGGVMVEDERRAVVLVNHTFCQLFGLAETPAGVVGENFASCAVRLRPRFSHPEHFEWQLREVGEGLQPVVGRELEMLDGRVLEWDYQPIVEQARVLGRLWLFWDVTEKKHQERELRRLASTDTLTGLPNRRVFLERLDMELARLDRYDHSETALLMLDLDHFKQVNDRHGHGVGDLVLQKLGELIQAVLRRTDLAGRMGGEEFALLLPGTGVEGAVLLAERLRESLRTPLLETGSGSLRVTLSVGVTLLAHPGDSAGMALARADQALYRAKELGRDRVEVLFRGE